MTKECSTWETKLDEVINCVPEGLTDIDVQRPRHEASQCHPDGLWELDTVACVYPQPPIASLSPHATELGI